MTLVDIKNLLFSHFLTQSTFDLSSDVDAIVLSTNELDPRLKEPLFKAGLDEFVKSQIVAEIAPGVYILTQPLDSFNQSVIITPIVAEMVADLLTELGGPDYHLNKMSITSDNIGFLCQMCHRLLDEGIEDVGMAD